MAEISVICAAYNMENVFSFGNSVESILSQSFRNFELIICDDGSVDETYKILSEYARADSRIRLIRNEKNEGLAKSLNKCIEYAGCEMIARHDLDDISHPLRLEYQLSHLRRNADVAVLGTGIYLFDRNGVFGKREYPEKVENEDFLFSCPYMHGSVMMRRSALSAVDGYRVSKVTRRTEDYDLFMRLAVRYRGENLREKLYYYLEDENTKKRRKYRYRIDEARVRASGFRKLGMMPRALPYVFKPLVVGLIPNFALDAMKKKYYGGDGYKQGEP